MLIPPDDYVETIVKKFTDFLAFTIAQRNRLPVVVVRESGEVPFFAVTSHDGLPLVLAVFRAARVHAAHVARLDVSDDARVKEVLSALEAAIRRRE